MLKSPERALGGLNRLMFRIIYGDDRASAAKAVESLLGANYEVFEGEDLTLGDLPSIFRGLSLFGAEKRRILLKNLGENAAVLEKVIDYADTEHIETEHEVVVWEGKIDKRSVSYKRLKAAGVEPKEFTEKQAPEARMVFQVFDTAWTDGVRAVKMLEKIEEKQDPYMFFGLLVTQAIKKFDNRAGDREKQLLKELSNLDIQMKTTSVEPWLLVKSFLLRVSEF